MAPTNIIRDATTETAAAKPKRRRPVGSRRDIVIHAGRVVLRARLSPTPTADRIWQALPLYTTAERRGDSVHFEIPIESGREKDAKWTVTAGEIGFWCEEDRIVIGFGPTPLSRPGEIRMPSPVNIWAICADDVGQLRVLVGGERVAILHADS